MLHKGIERYVYCKIHYKDYENHNTDSEVDIHETKKHSTKKNEKTSIKSKVVSQAYEKASRGSKKDHKSNESALKSDQTIFNKVEELEKIASDLRKDVAIKWQKLSNSVKLLRNGVKC